MGKFNFFEKLKRKKRKNLNADSGEAKDQCSINGIEVEYKENKDGVDIYEAKNVTEEKAKWLAAQTNFDIGVACFFGNGVKKDVQEAIKYFTMAADQGNVNAQANLGIIYYFGKEVPQDCQKGAMYLKKAADGGVPQAALNFAIALLEGNGVAQDVDLALKYLLTASNSGYPDAMLQLARMYANKIYIEQDLEKAEYWAKRAIACGAGDLGRQTLATVTYLKDEALKKNMPNPKTEQQSTNPDAWRVKAFANLIKMRRIELAYGDRYVMDSEPMDGYTLYDAFVSIRLNLDRQTAELDVPNNFLVGAIRNRIVTVDMHDMGDYGRYESMYEVKRDEFYFLILKYLNE